MNEINQNGKQVLFLQNDCYNQHVSTLFCVLHFGWYVGGSGGVISHILLANFEPCNLKLLRNMFYFWYQLTLGHFGATFGSWRSCWMAWKGNFLQKKALNLTVMLHTQHTAICEGGKKCKTNSCFIFFERSQLFGWEL